MHATVATTVLLAFAAAAPAQQSRPLESCPLLATTDAATLTGPGVEFYSGREATGQGGLKTYLCFFGVGQGRSLTVKTGPSLAKTAAEYQKMYEPLRRMSNEQVEPGLGEYAYSKLEGGAADMNVVKGALILSLELKGDDLKPADLDKLRAAAKKALAKL